MLRWTVHLEGGPRRVNHAAVAINEKIYSFGGYCTGEDYETRLPIDVHVLDIVSLRWKLIPQTQGYELYGDTPYQRYGHSAVAYGDSAFIWGGRNDTDGACNILYNYDTTNKKWSNVKSKGPRPGARDGHSACVINDKMYIFGGYEERIDRFSDDIYCFDFNTKSWSYVRCSGTPARWRDFHTAIGIDNIMYIFGGRSDAGGNMFTNNEMYCNKIQAFDTLSKTWFTPFTCGIPPPGRRSHSVFVKGQCMYIFGGYNGEHDIHFKDVFKYDTVTKRWSMVNVKGQGPCARRRQCCCMINDKVYLFGGTSPSSYPIIEPDGEEISLMDLCDLHVLDMQPTLKTLAKMVVLDHKLDTSFLPRDIRWELSAMTTPNVITRPMNSNG
ncbi:kelch domain-containing protein 3 [Mactra antiquata]